MLDYDALRLRTFYAGAQVWHAGAFHRVADPFRHPLDGVASLPNPVGSVQDKLLVGLFRWGRQGQVGAVRQADRAGQACRHAGRRAKEGRGGPCMCA